MDDETQTDMNRPPAGEDDLAPLLHLAGRRPRLPEGEVAPIRTAAREVFRRQARRSASRRRLAWTAAAGLAASLLATIGWVLRGPTGPGSHPPVATFAMRIGEVSIPGSLSAGAVVTTGDNGLAAVRLPAGASVRIDARSAVRFDSPRLVTLQRGAIYVDSGETASTAGIEVATAFGSVRDVGTQFEVRLRSGEIRVRVREGKVIVDHAGEARQARAGGELVLQEDGGFRRAEIPVYGPGWEWVQRLAPPLAIEGASLADFLDWVSRETGLRWRLAEPADRSPEEILLHGSIAGLTAEEALAVVLPSCGYRHRREGDQLWVEPAGDAP